MSINNAAAKPHHQSGPDLIDVGHDARVTIPGGHFLLTAQFHRQGGDLLLVGNDGHEVLVRGFFDRADPPDLMTEEGGVIPPALAARLAGPTAPGQYAQDGQQAQATAIGVVDKADGTVTVHHANGTTEVIGKGATVFQGDVIETSKDGSVGIIFADRSTFSLGHGGRMVMDELVYDPQSHTGRSAFSVVQGTFSFVSGQIAKSGPDAMSVKTPVMTIGIRGTTVAGQASAEGSENTVSLLNDSDGGVGQIVISNGAGSQVLTSSGQTLQISSSFQAPPPPVILPPAQIQQMYQSAVDARPPQPTQAPRLPTPSEPGGQPGQQGQTGQQQQQQGQQQGTQQSGEKAAGSGAAQGGTGSSVLDNVKQLGDIGTQQGDNSNTTPLKPDAAQTDLPKTTTSPPISTVPVTPITVVTNPVPTPPVSTPTPVPPPPPVQTPTPTPPPPTKSTTTTNASTVTVSGNNVTLVAGSADPVVTVGSYLSQVQASNPAATLAATNWTVVASGLANTIQAAPVADGSGRDVFYAGTTTNPGSSNPTLSFALDSAKETFAFARNSDGLSAASVTGTGLKATQLVGFHHVIGGSGGNTFNIGSGVGTDGVVTIEGGSGQDKASFTQDTDHLVFQGDGSNLRVSGTGTSLVLSGVERVFGSNHGDTLVGGSADFRVFAGGTGADVLSAGSGNKTLYADWLGDNATLTLGSTTALNIGSGIPLDQSANGRWQVSQLSSAGGTQYYLYDTQGGTASIHLNVDNNHNVLPIMSSNFKGSMEALSGNGQYFLYVVDGSSGTWPGSVVMRDLAAGTSVKLEAPTFSGLGQRTVALSYDGTLAAIADYNGSTSSTVWIFDTKTGQIVQHYTVDSLTGGFQLGAICELKFSHNNNTLVIQDTNGAVAQLGVHATSTSVSPTDGGSAAVISSDGVWAVMQDAAGNVVSHKTDGSATTTIALADTANEYSHVTMAGNSRFIAYWQQIGTNGSNTTEALMVYDRLSGSSAQALTQVLTGGATASSLPDLVFSEDGRSIYLHGSSSESVMLNPYASINSFNTLTAGTGTDTLFGGMALDGTAVLIQGGQGLEVHAGNTLVGANGGFTTLQGGGGSTRFVAGTGTESFIGGGLRSQQVVDFSNLSQDVFVDVRGNAFSSTANQATLYTHNGNSVVARDYISGIANVIGSQGNNTFVGSNSAETFVGGGGNNTFDGHGGADVYYFGAHTNVLDLRGNAFHGETVIDTAVNGASNYIKPMDDVGGFIGSERVGNDLVVSFDPSGGGGSITYKDYFAASNHNTLTVLGNSHDSAFVKDMQGTAVSASFNDGLAQSYQKVVGTTGSEIFTGATSSGPTDNVIMISSASVLADNSTYTKTGGDFIVGGANNILLGSGESSAYFNHLSGQTDTQAGGAMNAMPITFDLVADNRSSSTMASTLHLDGQLFAAIFQKAIIGNSTTYMYGVSDIYGSNNGDTVLGGSFDDGSGGNNWWQQTYYAGHGANTIYDLSTPSSNYGITTLMADYSMSGTGIVANFASTWSPATYTYAGTGDVVSGLSTGTVVHDGVTDHLYGVHILGGSAYNDTIISGQGGATFMSSRGSDYYDSEGGLANGRPADLMDYSDSSSVVIINLGASQTFSYQLSNGFTWSGTLDQGQAAHDFTSASPYIDTLHNVERISLGKNSGTLIGDGSNTWMDLSDSTSSSHPTVTVDLSNNTVGGFGGTDYVSGVVGFAAGQSNTYYKLGTSVTSNLDFEGDTGTSTLDLNGLIFSNLKQSVTQVGPSTSYYNGTITLDNGHTITYHNISKIIGTPTVLAHAADGGTYMDVSAMINPVIDLTNGTVTAGGIVYTIIGNIVTNQSNPGVIQIGAGTSAIIKGTLDQLQGITTDGHNGGGSANFIITDTAGNPVDDDLFVNHFYSTPDGKIYGLTTLGNATINLGENANSAQMSNVNLGAGTTDTVNLSADFHHTLSVFAGQNTTLNLGAGSSDANLSVYAYRSDLSHDTLTGSTGNNTLVLKAGSEVPIADDNAFVHMTKFQTIAVEDTPGLSQLELGAYASAMADRNLTIDLSANHHEANVKLVSGSGIDTTANHLFVKLGSGFNWIWTSNSANLTVDSSLGGMDIVQVGGIRSDFVHAQTAGHSITLVNTNGTDGTVTLMDGAEVYYNDSNLYLLAASGQNGTINAFADIQQGLHGFMVGSGSQLIGSPTATALGTLSFNGSDWTYQGTAGSSNNGMETFLLQDQAGGTHTVNLSVGFDPGGVNSYGTETVTEALTMNAGSHIYIDSQVDSSWHHDELTVSGGFTAGGELDVRLTSDSTSLGPSSGDSINIITASSNSGVFDKIYGLDGYTGQGIALNPIFSNTGVSLQATTAEVSSAGVFNSTHGSGADVMIGTGNEQTLVGGGGADVILAGHGKNTVVVGDTAFSYLDGGSGVSTLKFNFATGSTIDLTGSGVVGAAGTTSGAHRSDSVENFSVFDLSSSHGSTLNLNDASVFSASAVNNSLVSLALGTTVASHALVVVGGSANTVNFSGAGGWHQDANAVNLTVNGTTDSYTVVHGTHNGQNETVYVQHDVHVGLPPP